MDTGPRHRETTTEHEGEGTASWSTGSMNRRAFLARTGAAAALAGLAGCGSPDEASDGSSGETPTRTPSEPTPTPAELTESAPVTRHGITFETVLHAVGDLGMDRTGQEPIDDALDRAYGDSTLVVFPPGAYLATKPHVWKKDVSGFGMLGLGETKNDVEFVFPKGNEGAPDPANYWFLRAENGRDHLLENVTIQQTDDMVTGVGMVFWQEDGLQIQDVEVAGFNPAYNHDPGFCIIAAVTSQPGVGVIDGFTCTDGGVVDLYPKRKIPIASYRNHRGELRILNPHIANAGEHSMYVSRTRGCVRVENGLFVNNDNSNLRLSGGGHPEKRSWAKDCRILIDTDNAENLPSGERYEGARGIWVESGSEYEYGYNDLLLENIQVEALSNARPAVLLLHEHSHGSLTVRNCSFRSEVENATVVDSRFPYTDWVQSPYALTMEDVSVSTTATRTVSGYAVRITSRPESVIRNVDIELVTGAVDGMLIDKSDGTRILGTQITTSPTGQSSGATGETQAAGENSGIVLNATDEYSIQNAEFQVPDENILVGPESSEG